MAYIRRQIQHTARYMVNRCQHFSGEPLSKARKECTQELINAAIAAFSQGNQKFILIWLGNEKFSNLFDLLAQDRILFPKNTTYIMHRNGESYEKTGGREKVKIYDYRLVKYDVSAQKAFREMRDIVKPIPPKQNERDNEIDSGQESEFEHVWPTPVPVLSAFLLQSQQKAVAKGRTIERSRLRDKKYASMNL